MDLLFFFTLAVLLVASTMEAQSNTTSTASNITTATITTPSTDPPTPLPTNTNTTPHPTDPPTNNTTTPTPTNTTIDPPATSPPATDLPITPSSVSPTTPSTEPPTTTAPTDPPTTPSTTPPANTTTLPTDPPTNTTIDPPATSPPATDLPPTPSTDPPTTPSSVPPTTIAPTDLPTTPSTVPPTTPTPPPTPSTTPPTNTTTPPTDPPTSTTIPATDLPPTPSTDPPITPSTDPPITTAPTDLPTTPATSPPATDPPATPTTTPPTDPPTDPPTTPSTTPPANTTTLPTDPPATPTTTPPTDPPTDPPTTPSTTPPANTTTLPTDPPTNTTIEPPATDSPLTPSSDPPITPSTDPPTTPSTDPPTTPAIDPPTTTAPTDLPTTAATSPPATDPPTTPPTTTPPPAPSTTPPPLVCINNGTLQFGVCICPDEWAGETCSKENFCEKAILNEFSFPRTPIGWFAYSENVCEHTKSNAGKPLASTRCSIIDGSPRFDSPHVFQCDLTLSDIQQNLTSPADLESLATSTQILTSKPEELTAENVTAAAEIANTLLLFPNATESVRVAAVATVSQLLNSSTADNSQETNATLGLTLTLDQLSMNLSLTLNTSQSQVVQPNLVVQSAQIPAADTQGVQFTSLSGLSGSFVADRIQLNTNTSTVGIDDGFRADALIYIQFSPDEAASETPTNVSLGFVLYQNDRFFRSGRYKKQEATIRVLSASVKGHSRVVPQHVEMMFRPSKVSGTTLFDFACVFWNYSEGDWSTTGCSKGNSSDELLRCLCNHTTNFAALLSFRKNYKYAEALDWISTTGLSISILGLVLTIIHHIKENFNRNSRERQNNQISQIALLCIYISLLAFIITFLSGVGNSSRQNNAPVALNAQTNSIPDSDERVEPDHGSCSAVVALLHFLLLATFMWSSVYTTQLVLLIRTMSRSLPPYWTKLSLVMGWGVPAIVMAITLGATYRVDNPLGYRQEEFCWLAALDESKQFHFGKPMFGGFLVPVSLILIYNVILLVLVSLTTCRTDSNLKSTSRSSLKKKFLISFSLAVLLGLSWTLGYLVLLTTGYTHLIFSIVFCLCTTTQGFQIFILFTARTPSFRAAVSRSMEYVSTIRIQLKDQTYSLTKNSGSRSSSEVYRDLRHQITSDTITLQEL